VLWCNFQQWRRKPQPSPHPLAFAAGIRPALASAQVKNLYVNAARVPRIFEERGGIFRHHVDLLIENGYAEAIEVLRQTEEP
jgi:hypothetical protein